MMKRGIAVDLHVPIGKILNLKMNPKMNLKSKWLKNRGVVNFTPLHHSVEETGHQYANHR